MWSKINKTLAGIVVLLLLFLPIMTQAATFRGGENLVISDETKDLYAAGSSISIIKSVDGDLTAAGGTVAINPGVIVSGDINLAGGQIWLEGQVADDARIAGGMININGPIDGDLLLMGGTVFLNGPVKGDVYVAGGTISVGGEIDGKLVVSGGEIIVDEAANIHGDFDYYAEEPAQIASGANVGGRTSFHQVEPRHGAWEQNGVGSFIGLSGLLGVAAPLVFLLGLVAILLLTLLVIFAAPLKVQDTTQNIIKHPWKSLGWGLAYLIAFPIVGLILLIIPFTFLIGGVLLLGYLLSLLILPALLSFFIGSGVFRLLNKRADFSRRHHLAWSALLGAVIYSLLMFIPLLGGLIIILGFIFSAGSLVMVIRPLIFKKREWTKSGSVPSNL